MIAYLEGIVAGKAGDAAVIDVGGIGFSLGMSGNSLAALPDVGKSMRVYAYMHTTQDGIQLFGFAAAAEKAMFERLISVSSVGPKMALAALSTFSPEVLSSAIMAGDVDAISRIPGIGKKKAQRIVLELQGILSKADGPAEGGAPSASAAVRGAMEALLSMGFTSAEADLALKGAEAETEAEFLQFALRRLGQ